MKRTTLTLSLAAAAILSLAFISLPALASGGSGGGGSGGGGKTYTIRYTGYVTAMNPQPEGVYVQIGTSYYNTGLVLVVPTTKITLNNNSATIDEIWIGDLVAVDATYTGVAVKLQATGLR